MATFTRTVNLMGLATVIITYDDVSMKVVAVDLNNPSGFVLYVEIPVMSFSKSISKSTFILAIPLGQQPTYTMIAGASGVLTPGGIVWRCSLGN